MCSKAFRKVKELEAKVQRHKAHPSRLRRTPLKGRFVKILLLSIPVRNEAPPKVTVDVQ